MDGVAGIMYLDLHDWRERVYTPGSQYCMDRELAVKVFSRDDYRCQSCGRDERLGIHHITPRAEGGADIIENLIVLCNQCHDAVEEADIHSRELIKNWSAEKPNPSPEVNSEDWHAWVYGGGRRPRRPYSVKKGVV